MTAGITATHTAVSRTIGIGARIRRAIIRMCNSATENGSRFPPVAMAQAIMGQAVMNLAAMDRSRIDQ